MSAKTCNYSRDDVDKHRFTEIVTCYSVHDNLYAKTVSQ